MRTQGPPYGAKCRATSAQGQELKQERALRTREAVLCAAAHAFAENGYSPVTVQDIARLCGMTKGAVYFHFTGKEALAVDIAESFYERVAAVTNEARQVDHPPLDTLCDLFARLAERFRDDIVIKAGARLQIERSHVDVDLPTPYVDAAAIFTEILTQARQDGSLASYCDPEALSRALLSAFFGMQHISWVLNDRQDIMQRAAEILDLLLLPHRV